MAKILTRETMQLAGVGKARTVRIYKNTARENLTSTTNEAVWSKRIVAKNAHWRDTAARDELLKRRENLRERARALLQNAATGYDAATIQELAGIYAVDLARHADEYADYTPVIYIERFDENAPEIVSLRDYLPYTGKEEDIMGSSDTVPLMQHKLPENYAVTLNIRGFGDKTTLRELIFNPFHKTENIIESAARILADEKNADSISPIVGATYNAAHSQPGDTSGATYDLRLYNTLKKALYKALGLYNKPTGLQNSRLRYEAYLLINPIDLINVQPVVNGALSAAGGIQQITAAIPFDGVIPYGGGLNDGQPYGSATLHYPGASQGEAYVIIKVDTFGGYRITKQAETMEMGNENVLGLTTENRAWRRIRGVYSDWVLPQTEDGKQYGAVVKVTLPAFA
jgi:hypothetical protein